MIGQPEIVVSVKHLDLNMSKALQPSRVTSGIRACLAWPLRLSRGNLDALDLTRLCWHCLEQNAFKEMYG